MYSYPATELFSPTGDRRVTWSNEEHEAALAEGWSETAPLEPSAELLVEEPAALDPLKKRKGRK